MITARRLIRAEPSFGLMTKFWQVSWLYVVLLCTLAGVGYAALYSAGGGPEPYASKHILRFAFGLVMMLSIAMVDIRFIARFSYPIYAFSIGLLVLVLRMGHVGKGAQRWIDIGGLQLQPSELAKIGLIMALAAWFHRATWERVGNPLFLIPPAIMVAIPVGLILKEPNLGTAVITAIVGGAVILAAGLRWWKVLLIVAPIPFGAKIAFEHLHDYQRARITTFLNPESDPLGAGYNIIQSKIALGSGGFFGKGFMQGTQGHLNFLPEKQTDFIFTMLAEEFGFVGGVAVLGLLSLIVVGRRDDRAAVPPPVWTAAGPGDRDEFLHVLLRQYRDGDGRDPRRRGAAAACVAWRLGDADGDVRLRAADVGARAPRRGIREARGITGLRALAFLGFLDDQGGRPVDRAGHRLPGSADRGVVVLQQPIRDEQRRLQRAAQLLAQHGVLGARLAAPSSAGQGPAAQHIHQQSSPHRSEHSRQQERRAQPENPERQRRCAERGRAGHERNRRQRLAVR